MKQDKPSRVEQGGDESFLSRWSRRKLEDPEEREETEAVTADAPEASVEPVEEVPPLTDADMPDIDSLTEDSDYSPFMSPGVSDELRNLALRKLFRAPVFNIRDGLDEYDDDFTTFEKLGDIVTADMKHQVEMQQKRLREAMEAEQAQADEALVDEIEDIDDSEDIDDDEAVVAVDATAPEAAVDGDEQTTEEALASADMKRGDADG